MVEPVRGVTAENYVTLAAAFIRANGNVGFFIIRDAELAVPEFPCTPKAFHAWMRYFDAKKICRRVFDARGMGCVPSMWPSEFDGDWPKAADRRAIDEYEARLAQETRSASAFVDATARKIAVKSRLGYDPAKTRGTTFLKQQEEKPTSLIDKDLLFECHGIDMAQPTEKATSATKD